MPYDKDTGVAYKETVIRQHKCPNKSKHDMPLLQLIPGPARGARSLIDTASNTLVHNLAQLDASSLDGVHGVVVTRLWQWLKRSRADSLHAWRVFAGTGFFNKELTKTCMIWCYGQDCLSSWAVHADSAWLTDLTIDSFDDERTRLAVVTLVPKIANLRFLSIHGQASDPYYLGDRDLRAWAFEAAERNALSKLETVVIEEQRDITINALQYLHCFPSLTTFATCKCGIYARNIRSEIKITEIAAKAGWQTGTSIVASLCEPSTSTSFDDIPRSSMHRFMLKKQKQRQYRHWPDHVHEWASMHSRYNLPALVVSGPSKSYTRGIRKSRGNDLWCFERDWNHKPVESTPEEAVARKRRNVVSNAASQDMMSGIF